MKSMTGMGRAHGQVLGGNLRLEIKSVNHRFCEVSVRSPSRWSSFEVAIRQLVRSRLGRGKIDVQIAEDRSVSLSGGESQALKSCYEYLEKIRNELGIKQEITLDQVLSGMREWVNSESSPEEMWLGLQPILIKAITELEKMRSDEGLRLKVDIENRFKNIEQLVNTIDKQSHQVSSELTSKTREKLKEKFQDTLGSVDETRLMQEVLFYLDRMDITEELKRLESHLQLAFQLLKASEPIGRKMDFLLQEIQRELNTLSNKAQSTDVSHLAVDGKVELEKIREQIQNIE